MAKLGQLFLQRGRWGERQLLSEAWIRDATRAHVEQTVNQDHYGYGWWVKGADYPGMFEAVGRGGQRINVWPAKDLVVVFTGGGFEPGDLGKFILKALQSDQALPGNPRAGAQLKERIAAAAKPPRPQSVAKLRVTDSQVSGKKFQMSENNFGLRELALEFKGSAEARAELVIGADRGRFLVGLDGVERISTNTLVKLPAASKGGWMGEETFLLQVNLAGGINCYTLKLSFADEARKVDVELSERTGLNEEKFTGVAGR